MKPSAQTIYRALLRGERLTPLISWKRYGILSLSQRCGELIREGVPVVSKRVKGESYHQYFIERSS